MSSLNNEDVLWCVSCLPKAVKELMTANPGKLILAGGFIRACISNEQINDVDLFASLQTSAYEWSQKLAKDKQLPYSSENAYTIKGYRIPIQIIHRWVYDTPEAVIASFDFTIAAAAIWATNSGWVGMCHDRYYSDLASKRLVYTNPIREEAAGGSTLRVLKFYQKGYRIPLDSFGDVLARLFAGIDKARLENAGMTEAQIITGLLREVDPAIDLGHLSHLPALKEEVTLDNPETLESF